MSINATERRAYVRRWNAIRRDKAANDHETALLARDIRGHFPGGGSGDIQFRRFVINHFHVGVSTADKLLRMVRALGTFRAPRSWMTVGGWRGVALLMTLRASERQRVIEAVRADNRERGLSCSSYGRVRELAFGLNIRSRSNRGRPTQTRMERRMAVVGAYLRELHQNYELPAMPRRVVEALLASDAQALEREAA